MLQVACLARQRDGLAAEIAELGSVLGGADALAARAEGLAAALAAESDKVGRYAEVRSTLESQLGEAVRALDSLRQQHGSRVDQLRAERDAALLKVRPGARAGSTHQVGAEGSWPTGMVWFKLPPRLPVIVALVQRFLEGADMAMQTCYVGHAL